ncbi:hypothetical protein J5X84_01005 [Streptosporangiaceae bacterium NEAU-GS5]|nr:hypothetical protein [Streptosporangiaceae bacterium NEAU-GS5]
MRRAVAYSLAWCGATALAVGVAWLGVRDVLRDTVLDQPPLPPVASIGQAPIGQVPTGQASISQLAAPAATTQRAAPPTPTPSRPRATPSRLTQATPRRSPSPSPRKSGGQLRTITLAGGRATVELRSSDCRMVSAVPNEGYQVMTWETATWIRVAFVKSGHESSAFCLWDRLPPRVETYEA